MKDLEKEERNFLKNRKFVKCPKRKIFLYLWRLLIEIQNLKLLLIWEKLFFSLKYILKLILLKVEMLLSLLKFEELQKVLYRKINETKKKKENRRRSKSFFLFFIRKTLSHVHEIKTKRVTPTHTPSIITSNTSPTIVGC